MTTPGSASPTLVRDLMTVGVPTCKRTTPVQQIARFLLEHEVEGMCVLDEDGNGIGVVGTEELLAIYDHQDMQELTAEQVMREGMPTVQADIPLPLALQMMRDQHTRIAYLTHNAAGIIYPAAWISIRHYLRHLAAQDEADLRDLGIHARRRSPVEAYIERRDAARRQAQTQKEE